MSEGDHDADYMRAALALGRRNLGRAAPNPAVGALVVRGGVIVGRGFTGAGGRPHAETLALSSAGDAARGATIYVTLEPCSHHGETPPCVDAIIASGVARVVTAMDDPDPRVAGRGHALLRAAGLEVATQVLEREARRDHLGHLLRVTQGRPMVTLKLARTIILTVFGTIFEQARGVPWRYPSDIRVLAENVPAPKKIELCTAEYRPRGLPIECQFGDRSARAILWGTLTADTIWTPPSRPMGTEGPSCTLAACPLPVRNSSQSRAWI